MQEETLFIDDDRTVTNDNNKITVASISLANNGEFGDIWNESFDLAFKEAEIQRRLNTLKELRE